MGATSRAEFELLAGAILEQTRIAHQVWAREKTARLSTERAVETARIAAMTPAVRRKFRRAESAAMNKRARLFALSNP